jgi:WD40 repeat protein
VLLLYRFVFLNGQAHGAARANLLLSQPKILMRQMSSKPVLLGKVCKAFIFIAALIPVGTVIWLLGRGPVPPSRLWDVSFLNDGNTLVTVGGTSNPDEGPAHGELVFWDLVSAREKLVVDEDSCVRSVSCAADGQFVAIAEFSGSTKLVNSATGKIIATMPIHKSLVNAVFLSPDGKIIANGSFDGTVTISNELGKIDTITLAGEKILNVAISPKSTLLAVSVRSGNAFLFDLLKRAEPRKLAAYDGPMDEPNVEIIAFAPDGRSLITGCQSTLRVWDPSTGTLIREMKGESALNAAAFSPDGTKLASVDSLGNLVLWNPSTGEIVNSIAAHSGISYGVNFSSDGKRLATVGLTDYAAKIWDAQSLALLTTLRRTNVDAAKIY